LYWKIGAGTPFSSESYLVAFSYCGKISELGCASDFNDMRDALLFDSARNCTVRKADS